jgi:hypothetical protein
MQLPVRPDVVFGFTGIQNVCEGLGLLRRLRGTLLYLGCFAPRGTKP